MSPDIVIVGAGPAGLCLARALSGHGLSIVVLERQAEQALAEPAFDGREIALTHGSQALLERLGLWARLPAEDVAVLRDAQVFNGPSLFALKIRASKPAPSGSAIWWPTRRFVAPPIRPSASAPMCNYCATPTCAPSSKARAR